MSIKLIGVGVTLTTAQHDAYQAPLDCVSATIATGTVANSVPGSNARLYMYIPQRGKWVVHGGIIGYIGSPWIMPPVTLMPGETIAIWSDLGGTLDVNFTVGEQR